MHRRLELASVGRPARLDGVDLPAPARFYRRTVTGGTACALWIGGARTYDVAVYDEDGQLVGSIGSETPSVIDLYDRVQRSLVAEGLREINGSRQPLIASDGSWLPAIDIDGERSHT